MRMACFAAFRTALCVLFLSAAARAETALPQGYAQAIEQAVQAGAYPAVGVGWIDGADRDTWFFGSANADSVFEIGAVTEIFSGLLLAQAAYEGKVRLQTPLRELLAADFAFADPAAGAITLEALATHHAGLPPVPPNLMPLNAEDPYADYAEPALRAFLANYRGIASAPDYAYSTLDAGLLGYLLGRAYAANYPKLLNDKVLVPLGMKHSGFDDSPALLGGHARGETAAFWHFGVLAGSAGMRSRVDDLLDFLQLNLRPGDSPLRAALLLARQPRARTRTEELGLGWNIHEVGTGEQAWPLVWRASSTAGFSTFIGFRTDRQQGLVLLANADAGLSSLGMALLQGDSPPPPPPARAPAPTSAQLDAYPGLYQVRSGTEIIVRRRDDNLSAQLGGQPAALLHADGDDVFDAGASGFGISFQREAGRVTNLLLNRDGMHFLAERLSARAPHVERVRIAVDANASNDLVGDYRLDADTLARIGIHRGVLSLQVTGRMAIPLQAFAKDRFACDDDSCELSFKRDAEDRVASVRIDFAGTERDAPQVHWIAP
ncbi:MAG: serine hydrolase [Rudaea sp.]|nr:serine hydrolase [Rudaea sp.]